MDDANALNLQGLALYKKGKYDESIEFFDRAIEINPGIAEYYNNKGKALKKLGKVESIACFTKAVDLAWPTYDKKGKTEA
jgi:tetratricopeptide (TPR) repeat protein